MADEPTPSVPEAPPPGDATIQERTVEAVEAEYRARISGKDRAHAAEKAELERQLVEARAAAEQAAESKQQREDTRMTDEATLRAENERLKASLEQEQQKAEASALAQRKAQFPQAAEALGDGFASMPEETLTTLEQRLTTQTEGGMILPTSAARPAAGSGAKPVDDQSIEELRATLKSQVLEEFAPGR